MLAIRLQRLGRTGRAMYRLAVQEAQKHPSSGRVIKYVGSFDPHTKQATIDAAEAQRYLNNGAQPTSRVVRLLEDAGVAMPAWVTKGSDKKRPIKNTDKLRRNQPKAESVVETAE